jgi:hypothetical protein
MQGTKLVIEKSQIMELAGMYSDTLAAKKLGIAVSSFFLLRKKYGIPSFTKNTGNRRARKTGKLLLPGEGVAHPQYKDLRTETFDSIDSEEKAYFLGLMASDGHSNWEPDGKFISIELQDPDSEILVKFAKLLNYEGGIERLSREGKKPSGRLRVYSAALTESLIRQGISKTTETHSASNDIPRNLRSHFLRGLIDGDGHVKSVTKSLNYTSCSESLVITVSKWCLEEFNIKTKVNVSILESGKLFYRVTFGGKPRTILEWLYPASNVYIERKKVQAETWLSLVK